MVHDVIDLLIKKNENIINYTNYLSGSDEIKISSLILLKMIRKNIVTLDEIDEINAFSSILSSIKYALVDLTEEEKEDLKHLDALAYFLVNYEFEFEEEDIKKMDINILEELEEKLEEVIENLEMNNVEKKFEDIYVHGQFLVYNNDTSAFLQRFINIVEVHGYKFMGTTTNIEMGDDDYDYESIEDSE